MRAMFLLFLLLGCRASSPVGVGPIDTHHVPLATSSSTPATTLSTAPSSTSAPASQPDSKPSFVQEGNATYYADSLHGRKTASGEPYDKNAFTCAHKTLPFGTMLKVESLTNGKTVIVRVNDRGPFSKSRIIDLSRVAAEQIDLIKPGVMKVRISSQ
jgi:rare lipoprotein A